MTKLDVARTSLAIGFTALFAAGVAQGKEAVQAQPAQCVPLSQWVRPATGHQASAQEVMRSVSKARVVLLGERHDNIEHHRWQLYNIAALYALRPDLVLGFEMFPRQVQPVLDRWVAGELSEQEFLKQVDWDQGWRFDAQLYLPLFHFARINRIPMVALNVNPALLTRVREQGWDAVPSAERDGVTTPAPASRDYLKMLAGSFMHHQAPDKAKADAQGPAFKRFVEGQQLWDRAMAEGIARRVRSERPPLLVAVMGSGHMVYGFGVPDQLKDLGVKDVSVLVPWDDQIDCEDIRPGFADAVFGLGEPLTGEERPHLGVYLESAEGGVRVTKVAPDSIAAATEIKPGDLIVAIAGRPVQAMDDVVQAVQRMVPGVWLPIVVRRENQQLELTAKFPPAPG